jgi:prepilin-type N-terminal cleavage/methylation domain-containing protein
MRQRNRAFTLIELLVVMVIIGILIGLGVYVFASASARSRNQTRKSDLNRIKNALSQYNTDSRTYPAYDISTVQVFSADWQLTDTSLISASASSPTCGHSRTINGRLAPKYISSIPKDPRQSVDQTALSCTDPSINHNQDWRYLYISGPADSAPSNPATSFALFTTLEPPIANTDKLLSSNDPPLYKSADPFSYYGYPANYKGTDTNGPGLTANYMISSDVR